MLWRRKESLHFGNQTRALHPIAIPTLISEIEQIPSSGVSEMGGYYMEIISIKATVIYIS
jgi:hypothetical protein